MYKIDPFSYTSFMKNKLACRLMPGGKGRFYMKRWMCVLPLCGVLLWIYHLPAAAQEAPVSVSAKACILMEASTGEVLFEQQAEEMLPMASTTKIMTTLLCLESGDLDTEFVVDATAIRVEGSSMGLVEGDLVTKRALCYGMLLPSGNDAANATAVRLAGSIPAFADQMNAKAKQLGLTHTHFVTPSGLHDPEHYTTAHDLALLAAAAMQNETFRTICSASSAKVTFGNPPYDRWLENSNKLLTMCEGVIGVKTGFTDEAGRCLVSACQRNGITLLCVTLNDRNDWQDHENLYAYGFQQLQPTAVPLPDLETGIVAGGITDTVPLQLEEDDFSWTVGTRNGTPPDVAWAVESAPFFYAPVTNGQQAGTLVGTCNGRESIRIPLVAAQTVPAASKEQQVSDSGMQRLLHRIKRILE